MSWKLVLGYPQSWIVLSLIWMIGEPGLRLLTGISLSFSKQKFWIQKGLLVARKKEMQSKTSIFNQHFGWLMAKRKLFEIYESVGDRFSGDVDLEMAKVKTSPSGGGAKNSWHPSERWWFILIFKRLESSWREETVEGNVHSNWHRDRTDFWLMLPK